MRSMKKALERQKVVVLILVSQSLLTTNNIPSLSNPSIRPVFINFLFILSSQAVSRTKMSGQDNEETMLRKTLASLDVQRKSMEHEADAIFLELTTPPSDGVDPMGLDTPLVDNEGYPRGDIDVYRARTQRNRFRVLKTDHKEIEEKISGLLLQLARLKVSEMQCTNETGHALSTNHNDME